MLLNLTLTSLDFFVSVTDGELLAETTAVHVSGFPQFLWEIWDHIYPGSPPPTYHVYHNRLDRVTSEFTATVRLRPEHVSAGIEHGLTSGVYT